MKYCDNDEEDFLLPFFKNTPCSPNPCFIDVGANNGPKFSNTWALHQAGWRGFWVEADSVTFKELVKHTQDPGFCMNAAVGDFSGSVDFYRCADFCSGLSSCNPHYEGSPGVTKTRVRAVTLDQVVTEFEEKGGSPIRFISIDAENNDLRIVQAYSFRVRPELFMVEHDKVLLNEFDQAFIKHGYRRIFQNHTNAAYAP